MAGKWWIEESADNAVVSPTQLGRPIRIATFGSSIATPFGASYAEWDFENYVFSFPGNNLGKSIACPVLNKRFVRLVGTGGIIGQTTTSMHNRSSASPSATRKSVSDIISKRPDAVIMRGGGINDLSSIVQGSDFVALATASFGRHIRLVRMFTALGIHVIDVGIYGYSGGGAGDTATVQSAIVVFNNLCEDAAKNDLRHLYWNPNGIMGNNGGFFPENTSDGIHLSGTGASVAGDQDAAILDTLFIGCPSAGTILFDGQHRWANSASGVPSGCSIGGSTITSKTCVDSGLKINANIINSADSITLQVNSTQSLLASIASGKCVEVYCRVSVLSTSGENTSTISLSNVLYDAANALILQLGVSASGMDSLAEFTTQFNMPADGTSIGTSSYTLLTLAGFAPGSVEIYIDPIFFTAVS